MMLRLKLLLLLFGMTACQEYAEVKFEKKRVYIKAEGIQTKKISEVKWMVGKLRNQRVSKGVMIEIDFPVISKDDLRKIVTDFTIDSWVVKVKRRGLMKSEVLGYFSVPLATPGIKNDYRISQIKTGMFKVYYSSAAISSRFARFPCPAFKHNLLITKMNKKDEGSYSSLLKVSAIEKERLIARVEQFNYSNTILDGGKSLKGDYIIEIALYNKTNKIKKSNWIQLSNIVSVQREKVVNLFGCENFKIPPRPDSNNGIKDFRWN